MSTLRKVFKAFFKMLDWNEGRKLENIVVLDPQYFGVQGSDTYVVFFSCTGSSGCVV